MNKVKKMVIAGLIVGFASGAQAAELVVEATQQMNSALSASEQILDTYLAMVPRAARENVLADLTELKHALLASLEKEQSESDFANKHLSKIEKKLVENWKVMSLYDDGTRNKILQLDCFKTSGALQSAENSLTAINSTGKWDPVEVTGTGKDLFYNSKEYSGNFIGRWEFHARCNFSYDTFTSEDFPISTEGVTFDPEEVKAGDLIFVRTRCAPDFFEKMYPLIKVPFVIVAHGEYRDSFKKEFEKYLDLDNVIAWFGTHPHPDVHHEKFHAIPLGFATVKKEAYPDAKEKKSKENILTLRCMDKSDKAKLVYSNFSFSTHPERKIIAELFNHHDFCFVPKEMVDNITYLKQMSTCKFTISPPGLGIDCYRTWEALLAGSIPIVKSSQLNSLFEGLPILIIDDWAKVADEEFLLAKYEEMTNKQYDAAKLTVEYWMDRIEAVKKKFLENVLK